MESPNCLKLSSNETSKVTAISLSPLRLKSPTLSRRSTGDLSPSPYKKHSPSGVRYDRYIPSRRSTSLAKRCLFMSSPKKDKSSSNEPIKNETLTYQCALQNELLGKNITQVPDPQSLDEQLNPVTAPSPIKENILRFSSSPRKLDKFHSYSIAPISQSSTKLLLSPQRVTRKISKTPFKVLDAPDLQDDFYLNLLDWSSQNTMSVGLGTSVYLWSACTCQVSKLCDLQQENDLVTSVSWAERGQHLALGTVNGLVQIWDVVAEKKVASLAGHTARVGSLSWGSDMLCSGSRDHSILAWDHRDWSSQPVKKYLGHSQEVCGLRWSPDLQHLASGGNDNKLFVWSRGSDTPIQRYSEHCAAVKAISWSPHQHGLLASGGGTADRTIRFWNTVTGQQVQSVDTGSQVCNLAWSKSSNELVSTHGYSQNQIIVWRYPSLTQVAKLTGHTTRVLYLAMSPDGQTVVTGAGDETLRFWKIFYKSKSQKDSHSSLSMEPFIR